MGGVLGSLGLCCGSAACCFRMCPGTFKGSTITRIMYAVIVFLLTVVAWVMLNPGVGSKLMTLSKYTGSVQGCDCDGCSVRDCEARWSQLGVYRIFFSGTVFFGLMALVMIGVKSSLDNRRMLQNGLWLLKVVILIATGVGAFFIDNDFFHKGWGWIALFGGFVFLIIQLILLIDFAHAWADSWVEKLEEGSTCHKWLLILSSLGMYAFSLTAIILMYVFYTKAPNDGTEPCHLNKFLISVDLILAVVMTATALNGRVQEANPNSGLLQAGVVVSYVTYLTWSAISETDSACQPGNMSVNDTTTTVIGAMFTFIAVLYSTLRTSHHSQVGALGLGNKDGDDSESSLLLGNEDLEKGGEKGELKDDEEDGVVYNWSFFHLTFCLACLYLTMVLTDWATIRDGYQPDFHVGRGAASTWIKVVSGWLGSALFIWTLIAPICLPDRDFSR